MTEYGYGSPSRFSTAMAPARTTLQSPRAAPNRPVGHGIGELAFERAKPQFAGVGVALQGIKLLQDEAQTLARVGVDNRARCFKAPLR